MHSYYKMIVLNANTMTQIFKFEVSEQCTHKEISLINNCTIMFIKKDKRKINDILREEGTTINTLKLSKRTAEFQGSLRIICHETKVKLLYNLRVLNLYDNALNNIDGIGLLSQTPLEEINLGCNKLDKLPVEVCVCVYVHINIFTLLITYLSLFIIVWVFTNFNHFMAR